MRDTITKLVNELEINGSYDGLFAHSKRGILALLAILARQKKPNGSRFFLLGNALPRSKASGHRTFRQFFDQQILAHILTVLRAGQQDTLQPLVVLILSLIEKTKVSLTEWEGGHEVPVWSAQEGRTS